MIRKTEPKPIRIFLQDGSGDLNIYAGDWWKANETMERAFVFAGYEVSHAWGSGGHNGEHGKAVFAEAMKWLWKDWPAAVANGKSGNKLMAQLLPDTGAWEKSAEQKNPLSTKGTTLHNGKVYTISDFGRKNISGICATPDQAQLYTVDSLTHWVWIHSIGSDGKILASQRFGWLHSTDEENASSAGGIACDTAGNVFVATNSGLQILDQTGRVNVILPVPDGSATDLWFGGVGQRTLYVSCKSGVYMRKLNTMAANSTASPVRPATPHL